MNGTIHYENLSERQMKGEQREKWESNPLQDLQRAALAIVNIRQNLDSAIEFH